MVKSFDFRPREMMEMMEESDGWRLNLELHPHPTPTP